MQCCRTCKYIDSALGRTHHFCTFPVVLPEVMIGSLLEDVIDDPDQYGGDCDCYVLDKSKK